MEPANKLPSDPAVGCTDLVRPKYVTGKMSPEWSVALNAIAEKEHQKQLANDPSYRGKLKGQVQEWLDERRKHPDRPLSIHFPDGTKASFLNGKRVPDQEEHCMLELQNLFD